MVVVFVVVNVVVAVNAFVADNLTFRSGLRNCKVYFAPPEGFV